MKYSEEMGTTRTLVRGMSEWHGQQPQTQHTILYVDDEPILLASWAELIETAGYRVLTANGGKNAMRLFLAATVHLVILDYEMPGMNGATVAAWIRQINRDVPIILYSGGLAIKEEELALFNRSVAKGTTLSVLLKAIKEVLPARAG